MNVAQTREHIWMLNKVKEYEDQIRELAERLKKLETKRGPGRPRKNEA